VQLREAMERDFAEGGAPVAQRDPLDHTFTCGACRGGFKAAEGRALDVAVANEGALGFKQRLVCGDCAARCVLADVAALARPRGAEEWRAW
jgi:hypothetical protein